MIEKEKFGAFVAQLRKEKGLTQKELAEKLFLSDKAVSKWERGLSMPDITVLTPLAEALGVSVAELLNCQRMEKEEPVTAERVDELVQKAVSLTEEPTKPWKKAGHWLAFLGTQAVVLLEAALLLYVNVRLGGSMEEGLQLWSLSGSLGLYWMLALLFGAYFWLILPDRLPRYYDENRIGFVHHWGMKMQLPGIVFNNSNWPHILKAVRVWCVYLPITVPILFVLLRLAGQPTKYPLLIYVLTTLFVPLFYVGKKYE